MTIEQQFLQTCKQAAQIGGQELRRLRGNLDVREKGPSDLVTQADLASQDAIKGFLLQKYPDHGFLGEEGTADDSSDHARDPIWIVDPLDGTTNYVHGLDNYCVSIALRRQSQLVVAAVYDPTRDACYSAVRGGGAFLNDQRICTSDVERMDQALIAASLPARVERGSEEVTRFLEVLTRCQALRRLGSAALNLCYVATGQLDAYWATSVKIWDIAAGILLVQEAGGAITGLDGKPVNLDQPRIIAAGQSNLHAELRKVLEAVDRGDQA